MTELKPLDVCRLCLISAERLYEITDHITSIISTCFSLKICVSSELPNNICQSCNDQLEEVYKYRMRIVRNELILLKKSRENSPNCLFKHSKDFQVDYGIDGNVRHNFNESPDVTDMADNVADDDEFNIVVKEANIKIKKQENSTILESERIYDEEKEQRQSPVLNIDIWQNLKIVNKEVGNLKLDKTDPSINDLNNPFGVQSHMKSNDLHITERKNMNGLNENTNNLQENDKPLPVTHQIAFELVSQNIITLEMDKENKNMQNLSAPDITIIGNESVFNNQGGNANVNLNHDKFYDINTDNKIVCLTCLKVFESQKELSIHYKTVELPKAMKEASRKFKDSCVKASKNDGGKSVFKCGICSEDFESKVAMIKHRQIHIAERPFQCNLCSRTYRTVADILRHGVVHNGFKFVCSYNCGYATVHLGALREHVKRHKKEFKYKCEKCGKCFQVKTWYDQHQNVHNKVRPFVCKLCGQSFSMARYLTAHRANVHPQSSKVKRYKCVQCSFPCDSRKSLVMHMKQKHGMKTDCLCDVCGQILPDQQKLILHRSIHEASRKFSCRFCKKTFNKKDHKTVHEKIHTGERLNCNSCPKSFTQRCSLRRHMKRYHQGVQESLEIKT